MPIDNLAMQRQSIGRARLPDGRDVASLPGCYGVIVIALCAEGPAVQGSAMSPEDLVEAADTARDVAIAVQRGEPDLIGYVRSCWERRRLRRAGREAEAMLP